MERNISIPREEPRQQCEERLRLAIDGARLGFWHWNTTTNELTGSDTALALFGFPAGVEVSYAKFESAIHPADRERVNQAVRRALNEQADYREEYRVVWPDGTEHWIGALGRVYGGAGAAPRRMGVVVSDLTERKTAEADRRDLNTNLERQVALRTAELTAAHVRDEGALAHMAQSEALFRALFEQAPQGVALIDSLTGRIYEANARFAEITGRTHAEMAAVDWLHITHLDDVVADLDNIARLNAGEISGFQINKRYLRLDGSAVWISLTVAPVTVEAGESPCYLCMIEDITARKEADERLRSITDAAHDAILMMDPQGAITYWNPAAERMLGYRAEEALGKNLHSLLAPERYHAEQQAAFPEFVRSGRGQALGKTLDLFARRQDGREIPISLSLSAVSLKGAWHAVGIIQDITERKQVEERLRESRKMEAIAHLTGGMAHQFNNILAVLVTGLDLAQTLNPGAEARAVLHQMQGQAHRAADLIKQLLAFSRQSMLRRQPLDLAALVARQGNQLAPFLGARITVRWHSPSGLAWVNADQEAMEQVVLNLCLNARNAMPDGGLLRLTLAEVEVGAEQAKAHDTAQPGRHVCLSVADTGCGMDDRTLKRLFEPFFTTQDVGKGTGLGLAEVRGIVNQHHGWLEVDSRVGKGSTFRVYLPAVAPPPPDPASPPPTG